MLELNHITFQVETEEMGDREILHDINLQIPDRRMVVITGPNGGGKSTLARIIAGIETPTEGKILLDGEDITDKTITERAQMGIGFAFQTPVRFKGIQVIDLLRLAVGRHVTVDEACSYLSEVGVCAGDYINREVNSSLSGGEMKRIEIATVLARQPRLSVFDEPEAGIDLWSFQNLIEVFESMREHIKDSSILIISHQERILNIADEIIVLTDGRLVRQGTRDEIMPYLMESSSVEGCKALGDEGRCQYVEAG